MRIWDVHPSVLCRKHLLGEHRELHGLWNIITQGKKGYSFHPETIRWVGKQKALYLRHEMLVKEMQKRGYNHASYLDPKLAVGETEQREMVNSVTEQMAILQSKNCGCISS